MGDTDASHYHGCQALLLAVSALRRNPTESFRKNFKMTSRFSLREALLVSLVLVDRRFFCIAFFWTSGTVDGNSMLPDEGARLDLQFFGFFSVYGVAIWRLKRSSPIFFQTWVESKQTDKIFGPLVPWMQEASGI